MVKNEKKERKPMTWQSAMMWAIVMICVTAIAASFYWNGSSASGACDFEGIQYVDVTSIEADCWGDFSDKLCPLPTNIRCEGELSGSMVNLISVINAID